MSFFIKVSLYGAHPFNYKQVKYIFFLIEKATTINFVLYTKYCINQGDKLQYFLMTIVVSKLKQVSERMYLTNLHSPFDGLISKTYE